MVLRRSVSTPIPTGREMNSKVPSDYLILIPTLIQNFAFGFITLSEEESSGLLLKEEPKEADLGGTVAMGNLQLKG